MKSNAGRQALEKYLESQHSEENIHFWNDCENYKKITDAAKR